MIDIENTMAAPSVSGTSIQADDQDRNSISYRSRRSSTPSCSVDARGMQGVVIEAMKTIQRYEVENDAQVCLVAFAFGAVVLTCL